MAQLNTREEMKQRAVEIMQQLKIYKPYINGFKAKNSKPCVYAGYGAGYWTYQYPELTKKMKEFEAQKDCVIFAVTENYLRDDKVYAFLYVDKNGCDITYEDGTYFLDAYVWNTGCEYFSEIGEIGVKSFGGGLIRIH